MSYNSATDSIINLDTSVNVATITDYTTLGTDGLVSTASVVGINPVSLVSLDSDSSIQILTRTLPGVDTVAPDLNTLSAKPSVSLVTLDVGNTLSNLEDDAPTTGRIQYWN